MTLVERRRAIGLNQRQFAKRIGCCNSYISRVEQGKEAPTSAMLEVIEEVLSGGVLGKDLVPFRDAEEKAELRKIWIRDYA